MHPTLHSGDWVVTSRHRAPRESDLVVALTRSNHHIIKRVASITGSSIKLIGDNTRLSSSHCEKPVRKSSCVGTVLASFRSPMSFRVDFSAPS